MKWNNFKKIQPKNSCEIENEIFCISDGKEIGLAMWVNLCKEDPDCGADHDEYDFKCLGSYIKSKYWVGPINRIYVYNNEYISEVSL
jgi:hypothetical protein